MFPCQHSVEYNKNQRFPPIISHRLPEDEYKQYQQREEYRNVVHRAQHNEQLSPQVRHETHQLQDAQQTERTQHAQTRIAFTDAEELLAQFHHAGNNNGYTRIYYC